jgi:hypothetical protein
MTLPLMAAVALMFLSFGAMTCEQHGKAASLFAASLLLVTYFA